MLRCSFPKGRLSNADWGLLRWGNFFYCFFSDFGENFGAGGGTRTHTGIRPSDFKSDMSTIPSRPHGAAHLGYAVSLQSLQDENNAL